MHIKVKVFPEAKKEFVEEVSQDQLRVFLREKPQNNAANKRLLEVLALRLHIPKNSLRIISGHKTFNKILEIQEKET